MKDEVEYGHQVHYQRLHSETSRLCFSLYACWRWQVRPRCTDEMAVCDTTHSHEAYSESMADCIVFKSITNYLL